MNDHVSVGVGKGNGEIKLYDHETQKLASILTKSKNPNMIDGHKNKAFARHQVILKNIMHALQKNLKSLF